MIEKSVLITGATGFLGSHVVDEFLSHGYSVIATGRNNLKLSALEKRGLKTIQCELGELSKKKNRVDYVVHCAALSTIWGGWSDFYENNVVGTQNVIDFCALNNVKRMIYVSSPSIYTKRVNQLNINANNFDKYNHLNNYIKSKIQAEQIVSSYSGEVESVIIRPRGIIGIGDTSIVPRLLAANERFGIPLINKGKNLIDLTCVENVALSIRLACEKPNISGNAYNITNGEPRAFKDLVNQFLEAIGISARYKDVNGNFAYSIATIMELLYKTLGIKAEPPLTKYSVITLGLSQTLDISSAQNDLGYKPLVTLDEGIQKYGAHFKRTHS